MYIPEDNHQTAFLKYLYNYVSLMDILNSIPTLQNSIDQISYGVTFLKRMPWAWLFKAEQGRGRVCLRIILFIQKKK